VRSETDDQDRDTGTSRRSLLRTAALAVITAAPTAGCDLSDGGPTPTPGPDPLAPLIPEALDLAARHESAAAAFPALAERLKPMIEAHRAHAAELSRATGATLPSSTSASASTAPTAGESGDPKDVLAQLRAAEQQAGESAAEACLKAADGQAALVGSIAAARATHVEALR